MTATMSFSRRPPTSSSKLVRFNTVNPPGNERPGDRVLAAYLQRGRLSRPTAGDVEDRPNLIADLADGRGATARPCASSARRHRARRRRGVDPRPVVGGRRGRLPVGPRRARHEVPGRGRGVAAAAWRARVAAARGELEARVRRRRGDRRRVGAQLADRDASRQGSLRPARSTGRRRGVRVRRPAPVRRLLRREGVFRFKITALGVAGHASLPRPATTRC